LRAPSIKRITQSNYPSEEHPGGEADGFVEAMTASAGGGLQRQPALPSVPVFLGHGTDDAYLGIELGRQAANVLGKVGLRIGWREYAGADQEGHWLKEPEEFDDIVRFLESIPDSDQDV
jgi:lysophospholipase II